MPQTFYDVVWIFIIYAFLGWCTEVAYAALEHGKFVNRGFLNGPYCPIYGCGVLIVVILLTPLKSNGLILFAGSFLLTSVLEFVTGFVMEKIFHNKWWDYSNEHFNIMGYVCLKFSILWGLACTFIVLILHPVIYGFIHIIPKIIGIVLISIILICFIVDLVVTVSTIIKFNRRLRLMNEIAAKLKELSNEIGENVYEGVAGAMEYKEKLEEKHADWIEEMEDRKERFTATVNEKKQKERKELMEKYNELMNHRNMISTRLMKAFPNMKSLTDNEILDKLKENMKLKINVNLKEKTNDQNDSDGSNNQQY
ncbi:MAG: hypothetical protein ACI4DO_05750 [Roseburia sp.]